MIELGFCVATALLFHIKLGNRNELLHFEKDLGRWALDALSSARAKSEAVRR